MTSPPLLDSSATIRHQLQLLAPPRERRRPSLWFIICDDQDRGQVVAPIDDMPATPTPDQCVLCASVVAEGAAGEPGSGLLLVILRPAPVSVTPVDRQWYHAVRAACAEQDIRPMGVWLVTPGSERELVADDVL